MIPTRIARLEPDGSTDTGFDPGHGLSASGLCVCLLPDGRVVAGGDFLFAHGVLRSRLAVFNADGSLAATALSANGKVRSLVLQEDGKLGVMGDFTTLGGLNRARVARLKSTLEVEAAFDPTLNGAAHAGALQGDGKLVVAGAFTTAGGEARNRIARLHNDPASLSLSVASSAVVKWLRDGALQRAQSVTFEVDTGAGFNDLGGTMTEIQGGWQVTGLSLTGSGTLRARAYAGDSHSSGVVESSVEFDFVPAIQVRDGNIVLSGGGDPLSYGDMQLGGQIDKTITIANVGLEELTLTGGTPVAVTGADWSIVTQPASPVPPGGSVTFTLRLNPAAEGIKFADLTIASDDSGSPFEIELTANVTPGPGAIDTSWQPVPNGEPGNLALQPDGILVTGTFTAINGQNRGRYARLSFEGALKAQSGSGFNNNAGPVAQMPDGGWLIAGIFTKINGVSRRLARFKADGSLDTTWNVTYNEGILEMSPLPDGSVFICGTFSTVLGQPRRAIAKLTKSGSLDTSWVQSGFSSSVCWGMAVLGNGAVIAATNAGLVKLLPTGQKDTSFTSAVTAVTMGVWPTFDGKLVTYGHDGNYANFFIKRLNADGSLDGTWTNPAYAPMGFAIQTDGKVLTTYVGTVNHQRLLATGLPDPSFVFAAGTTNATSLALDGLGRVYLARGYQRPLCRLINDGATQSLTVSNPHSVKWMRGGAAPEADWTAFWVSEDLGISWQLLGAATRIPGGWELNGINLPRQGRLKALAHVPMGMHESVMSFADLAVADISVEYPTATVVAPGGTLQFPGVLPGQSTDLSITIRNSGNDTLTGLSVSSLFTDWTVISLGNTSLAAGQQTEAVIRFAPSVAGFRAGSLVVSSSVPGVKNPYTLTMRGAGVAVPTASTTSATAITTTVAKLRGSVKPNHDTAKAWFEYKRTNAANWIKVPADNFTVAGFASVALSFDVSGLTPASAYHYRIGVYNSINTAAAPVYGATSAFNTL